MRLHDLFYEISTILGGIENKSFRLLDNVNDNEEKYIITQKKKYSTNYEKVERNDANDKKKIINCIESISNYRFENLSEVQDFRTRYLFTSSNGTPVATSERLILKKSWLSDNEIDIGNNISMTKYENNEILHITSLQFDILKTKSVVEEYTKDKDSTKEKIKIYNLFSNDNSNVDLKTEKEQHPSEYVEWKHDCTLISKLLEKGSNSSIVTLNVNIGRNHWIFFAGIDYHKGTETNGMKDDIYIYHFDSNYKSENPSSILNMNNEYCNSQFVSICRLLKLILLFGRSRQLRKNDMIIANDKKILNIKTDLYQKMNLMKDNIIHVTTTYQEDFHTCGLHIIRFFDEIWRIKHSSSEFSKEIFEKQLTESRQLRLHNEENLNLKSELLEHYLNVAFVIGIMTKSLFIDFVKHKFLESNNKQYEFVHSATLDITAEHDKFKNYNEKNAFSRKLRSTKVKESPAQQNYEELSNQVTVYFEDLEKKIDNGIKCQCCPVFPKKQLEHMKTNKIQDIHDFDHNVLMNLRWTCPRTKKTGRGAFYTKRLPSKNNPIFEKKSILELIKIWKPTTLWDFRTENNNVDGWYKDFLISRLSFNCNFTEIKIPDGGSCSEWLVSTILFSENKESEYGKYLNNLRRLVKIFPYEFSQDKHKTTEKIRLFYAESLYYGYSPNIEELLNLHINDNPTVNELYCSSVLWNLHSICDRNIHKYSKYVFQDCVRKFISMTPLQVGKLGCMWGTEDFLNWFQCLFNIRIFVINIQETDTQKYTTSSFVNELIDKGTQSYEEEHSNDKFFDLSIKNRLVPYGIIIVLMVESHFDRVYKLHNRTSPIIPSGSSEIEFLLPLLKISKTLWSSLNLNSIYQHNSNLISNQTMDINHELNFWFDHQIVFENKGQLNMFKFPVKYPDFSAKTFVENLQNKSSSIPFCSIRFPPKYLAYIIFYNVLQLNEPYNSLLSQINAFSIYLQEEDLETIDNYMQYFKEFIGKQQEYFGKVDNVFHDGKLNNHISDMMEIYKLSLYESSRTKISTKNNLDREDDNNWTKRLQYPLFRNLLNFDQFNKSMLKNNDKITNESKERSLNPEDENKTKDIRKVEISTNFSQPSFSVKLKSSKKSVAKQESTDNEIQIDPQKASNTLLSQSTVNTFNKNLQDNNVEMDPQTGAVDTSISQQTNIIHDNDTAAPPSTESNKPNPENPHVRENPIKDDEDKNESIQNLGISTKSSKPTIKITLKSTKNSVSNKESTDDVTKMDSQKATDSSMSESTSNSLDKVDEMNNYDEFGDVPSSDEIRQENDVSKSLFDTNKTGKVLRFSKENETDFDNLESPIKPNDGEFSGKDPKTEASKLSLEFVKNNNRPGKKLRLSLNNLSENESESESEKTESDDDDSSFFSFSSVGRFDFKLTQVFKTNMDCFAVVSSFESHPIRLDQLKQFQIKQPGSGSGDDHLDKLLLCSKQVHSQKSKQSITYEGMYGFVSKDHFSLVNKNETNISTFRKSPYIWQDLITTQIGQYSKEKAMEYFKGMAEDSKVLIHASTIAWDYLESFFHKEKDSSELFEDIKQFIKDQYSFLESKSLKIDYSTKNKKKHKLIGDTPFTSCHVLFWKNVEKEVEFIRSYTDVKTCVLMCFGPKEIIDERITFQLEIENNLCDPIDLVSNTILVFSPKKNKFKIQGNLNFHLILLFCIDETIVKRIQNTFKNNSTKPVTDWYSLFGVQQNKKRKSQSKETKETSSKPENRKNRKRTGSIFSSRRIRLGYIDLEVSQKQEGTKRSCLQDAFINAGFLFGKNIKEEMYKLFPPMEKKNACLEKIIKSPVITQNFELESEQFYTRVPGGNEWRLLHHLQGTGVYIVWGTVQPTNQKKEYHAFVYNSCFSEFNNKKYYGAIIDNRHHSKLRAFSQEDLKDHLTARKSLSDYFGGETRVNNWIRILDKI